MTAGDGKRSATAAGSSEPSLDLIHTSNCSNPMPARVSGPSEPQFQGWRWELVRWLWIKPLWAMVNAKALPSAAFDFLMESAAPVIRWAIRRRDADVRST